jgi:hypothetical protein
MVHTTVRLRRDKENRRLLVGSDGRIYRENQLRVLGSRSTKGLSDRKITDLAMGLDWQLHEVRPRLQRLIGYRESGESSGESGGHVGYLA